MTISEALHHLHLHTDRNARFTAEVFSGVAGTDRVLGRR